MRGLDPISEVLNVLRDVNPNLAKSLTKQVSIYSSDARERKRMKCEILIDKHRPVFEEIAQRMFPFDKESNNPLGYRSDSLFTTIHHLIHAERVNGSYGSKYDFGQDVVE